MVDLKVYDTHWIHLSISINTYLSFEGFRNLLMNLKYHCGYDVGNFCECWDHVSWNRRMEARTKERQEVAKEDNLLKSKDIQRSKREGVPHWSAQWLRQKLLLLYLPLSAWGRALAPSNGIHLSSLLCFSILKDKHFYLSDLLGLSGPKGFRR